MARVLRGSLFFAVLLASSLPARADPLLMFLFSVAREIATLPPATPAAPQPLPQTYPGTAVEPAQLRQLIDESFAYLSSAQRTEVFDALNSELLKPQNAALRGPIIEEFARRAAEVRTAQQRLEKLSSREKEVLADEFQKEVKALPPEDLVQVRQAIEKNVLPVPSDLNRLLLAAFD
ncbi:MAG TPA: hypothetical protein VFB08_12170 [Burkholderiales bacterium]|nr:hypothetical protein [Burkholderiales bacterium]